MTAWIIAGVVCLVVIVLATVAVVRLLLIVSPADDSDPTESDPDDWAWRSGSDAR